MSDEKPRCRTCGFIGIKNKRADETDELEELTEEMRLIGYQLNAKYTNPPKCHWKVYDLEDEANRIIREINPQLSDSLDPGALKRILDTPRDKCVAEWIQFLPGRSPKQHEENKMHDKLMKVQADILEVEKQTLRWQEKQAEKTLRWKEGQAEKNDRMSARIQALEEVRHQESRADSRSSYKLSLIAIGVAVLAFVAAIVIGVMQIARP